MISLIFARSGGFPRAAPVSRLAKILWTYGGWRDHAERPRILASMIIKAVNGTARNAQRLPGPDVHLSSINGPGQNAINAVDRLFVMVVAVSRSHQALPTRDTDFEGRNAAIRVFSRNQKAYRKRTETNGLVGRIDLDVDGPL